MRTLTLKGSSRSTEILIGAKSFDMLPEIVRKLRPSDAFLVTDRNVADLYLEQVSARLRDSGVKTAFRIFPPGEKTKSLDSLNRLYDDFIGARLDRTSLIIALGGGVIGDLATLAAATYMRGTKLLLIPTTLLSMADSCVGGKAALNHAGLKNMIGTFYQPDSVLIDTQMLSSLPQREYVSALSEVVKSAAVGDPLLFSILEEENQKILAKDTKTVTELIERSLKVKIAVVSEDETECGRRRVLNLGHTLAHALEAQTQFSSLLHGEAVSLGLVLACAISNALGIVRNDAAGRIRRLLLSFGLPVSLPSANPIELVSLMQRDKKATANRLTFILLKDIGQVIIVEDVAQELVRNLIAETLIGKRS
jgi:3-dehydroquinate synthase